MGSSVEVFKILIITGVLILFVSGFLPWATATYGSFLINISFLDLLTWSSFSPLGASAFSLFFYICSLIAALFALVKRRLVAVTGVLALAAGILFLGADAASDFSMISVGNGGVIAAAFANSVGIGIGPISAIIAGTVLLAASVLQKWSLKTKDGRSVTIS
jgi:hypothetical protein